MIAYLTALLLLNATPASVWKVELVDGSVFVAKEPPSQNGLLTLATLEDGTLISVRTERIESIAEVQPSPPRQPPSPWGGARRRGSSGEGFVLDNSTLAGFVASLPPEELPEPSEEASVMVLPETLSPEPTGPAPRREIVDRDGHGRAWWQARARPVVDAVRAARLREQTATRRLREAERNWLYGTYVPGRYGSYIPGYGPWVRGGYESAFGVTGYAQTRGERFLLLDRVTALRDAVEHARAELELAESRYDSLKEEARRAGAWPGWLRLP